MADVPECPEGLSYLWEWFMDIHAARATGGMGPSAIAYTEIAAWNLLTGVQARKWEVLVLREIDVVWLEEWSASRPPPGTKAIGSGKSPAPPKKPPGRRR